MQEVFPAVARRGISLMGPSAEIWLVVYNTFEVLLSNMLANLKLIGLVGKNGMRLVKVMVILLVTGAVAGCASNQTRPSTTSLFEADQFSVSIDRLDCQLLSATYTDKSEEGSDGAVLSLKAYSKDNQVIDTVEISCWRVYRGLTTSCEFNSPSFDPAKTGGIDCPAIDRLALSTVSWKPYTLTDTFANEMFVVVVTFSGCYVRAGFRDLSGKGSPLRVFTLLGVSGRAVTLDTIRLSCGPVAPNGIAMCRPSKSRFDDFISGSHCSKITSIHLQ